MTESGAHRLFFSRPKHVDTSSDSRFRCAGRREKGKWLCDAFNRPLVFSERFVACAESLWVSVSWMSDSGVGFAPPRAVHAHNSASRANIGDPAHLRWDDELSYGFLSFDHEYNNNNMEVTRIERTTCGTIASALPRGVR